MAELTFKSAGVSTREIDLSGPRRVGPVGIPAGVIGTALEGPAFVPINVASFDQFKEVFGATDGEKFGPIAASEWLRNAQSLVYLRILGAGNGKKRNTSTGNVTNAGFVVGDPQVQDNGIVGNNPFANAHAARAPAGSTYFLGTFMSESNGSTIFSSAGIQKTGPNVKASIADALDFNGYTAASPGDTRPCSFTLLVTTAAGGEHDTTQTIIAVDDTDSTPGTKAGANKIGIATDGFTDAQVAALVIKAINGTADADIAFATSGIGAAGVQGITAEAGTTTTKITLRNDRIGAVGNLASANGVTLNAGFGCVDNRVYTGGDSSSAVPILRGVLLAPSGVILTLSSSAQRNGLATFSSKPGDSDTATAADGQVQGAKGAMTGSVDLNSQEFVMLMNGYDGTQGKTHLTASFDMTAPNYFANVFNTDPRQTEKKVTAYTVHTTYIQI